jgi:glucokinase
MKYRIGIDLGTTTLDVGIADPNGVLVAELRTSDHRGKDDNGVLDCMVALVDRVLAGIGLTRSDVAGVGVTFPGHVRWPQGVSVTSSNFNRFRNFPHRATLAKRLGCPVRVDNDANAQALGEFRYGAGRGSRHMVYLTVSTGVGGGIIINGRLYRGASGSAGEFGHMIVEASGPGRCTCGNRGCLMAMASGIALPAALRRTAASLWAEGHRAVLPDGCVDFDHINGPGLANGFKSDNELCNQVIWEFGTYIGIGLYNVFQILNPQRVVLGGGLLHLPELFFDTARRACYDRAGAMMCETMDIRKGELGSRAGMMGAAMLFKP